jgi:proline iminopeptidase
MRNSRPSTIYPPRPARLRWLVLLLAAGIPACRQHTPPAHPDSTTTAPPPATPTSLPAGEAYLHVPDGRIWYTVSGTGSGTPVILLHGGPGLSSFHMKPFAELGNDRKVVRYDQLGGGKSDRITDTTLFTIPHFVRELDSLRAHLGYDKVHLLSHSWGTILAVEYYRAHPEHVASLVLGSAALDVPAWERNARRLIATLPDSMQRAIRVAEAEGKFDAPDYQKALEEFYGRYVWRHPVAADVDSTMQTANESIYNYMQGPSEFTITGTLKHYDATPFLRNIKVPTLYTVGEFDEADPEITRRFARLTPGARVAVLPGAGHLTPWDARDENVRVVREFFRAADGTATKR